MWVNDYDTAEERLPDWDTTIKSVLVSQEGARAFQTWQVPQMEMRKQAMVDEGATIPPHTSFPELGVSHPNVTFPG